MARIFRRGSVRLFGLFAAFIFISLCLSYIYLGQLSSTDFHDRALESQHHRKFSNQPQEVESDTYAVETLKSQSQEVISFITPTAKTLTESWEKSELLRQGPTNINWEKCNLLHQRPTNITTVDEYSKFDFMPDWIRNTQFWDKSFETRYEKLTKDTTIPPLKVIIVPHSHNDPGWLKTFTGYFESDTRHILNLVITKMQEYTDMTFIWSEISFLQMWWDQADPTNQRILKELIQSGRFEITTGGWVMTDEANVHIYAMLDQLIEGHQWIKTNLNYTPVTGWSVDPFGHGSTLPYLLSAAGFDGTIIQRIHYTWKEWLAKHRYGDFIWEPYWSNSDEQDIRSLLTHNMPFDIYSIKHSCGPHHLACLNFDFRKIPLEETESTGIAEVITDENIEAKAHLLIGQYARTASLYPHNIALIPLGDDFRYNKEEEVGQQYTNYKKLIDYINTHKDVYNAEIGYGLPKDYFRAIRERYQEFPSLKGDFFVYSDISVGVPAYWSGYFSTRPMYKILSRELENQLRSSEMIFTIAMNKARQSKNIEASKSLEKNYEKMILARRNLGLFQHHDAITGTSKADVMRDYGTRLFGSIQDVVKVQESCIAFLIQKHPATNQRKFVSIETERESFDKLPRKLPISMSQDNTSQFVVYNSGSQDRLEVITIRTTSPKVVIRNEYGVKMEIQINPVKFIDQGNKIRISDDQFEVIYLAYLPAMSLTTFTIGYTESYTNQIATIYSHDLKADSEIEHDIRNDKGEIQIENYKMRLSFDEQSGFLKTVTKKNMEEKPIQCGIKFDAYRSYQHKSGAYLFKPQGERHVLEQYTDINIFITSGPIAQDVTVMYGPFLTHTVRIFNTQTDIDNAIYIENDIDFEPSPKNIDTELFMRFTTDVENGEHPILYTDLNGFQYQKRVTVPSIAIEGNYFPITTAAFIQDEKMRVTVLTNHAQGAASYEQGHLEIMIDRRISEDDYRGLNEGVLDGGQTRQKLWVLIEHFKTEDNKPIEQNEYQVPSLFSNHLSNSHIYPASIYFVANEANADLDLNNNVRFTEKEFPCDLHMQTLRTLTVEDLPLTPSGSALMILHRQAYTCQFVDSKLCNEGALTEHIFNDLQIEGIVSTTLTGLKANDIIDNFSSIYVKPMDIQTFNITFVN